MKLTQSLSRRSRRELVALLLTLMTVLSSLALAGAKEDQAKVEQPKYPDITQGKGRTRGEEPTDKLTPELRILYGQYSQTRGGAADETRFSDEQLTRLFGIKDPASRNPEINIAVGVTSDGTIAALKKHRAKVYLRSGDLIFASANVLSLERLAAERVVVSIDAAKSASVPPNPKIAITPSLESLTRGGPTSAKFDNEFNAQNLTGAGVIIGIVDSGIDWKHPDFIKPDGTSRILYLWDMTDGSFQSSAGKIGTSPPVFEQGGDPGPGTIYTNQQINAALKGSGTVNSMDNLGHGTASAGTAAGNGRATSAGVPAGTFQGVAPEADLIIVKAGDCGGFPSIYVLGTYWIEQIAKARRQPVVINHSLGGHYTAHDGTEPEERLMNSMTGTGKPGVVLTVSAGNEGEYSFHGSGRFGPRVQGQADIESSPMEILVAPQRTKDLTWVNGYFSAEDDWGLAIRGSGGFLVDAKGVPFVAYIFKVGNQLKVGLPKDVIKPSYFDAFADQILAKTKFAGAGEKLDRLAVPLPAGNFLVWGFGATEKVKHGTFDLYLPFYWQGGFTIGAQKSNMVGSPGNAANVITVGSYDFRGDWQNLAGGRTVYNLALKSISSYSSPGGSRGDGIFKPDIAAPARYTISSLSQAAKPGSPACNGDNMGTTAGPPGVIPGGMYLAWSGTSAAAPFTAGVIALMLQKNPTLDANQVKEILIKTAIKGDRYVGAVPNPAWGYGKINPAAAIAATPAATARPGR